MEDTHVHALDYMSAFRRRVWWLIVPIVLSVVVGYATLRALPKEFRSSATLGVEAPIVSPVLVNQTPTLDNQERMRLITQQLMSAAILGRVAREEGLASGSAPDGLISRMRRRIDITVPEPVALVNEPRRLDAFIVSYTDNDAARAQRTPPVLRIGPIAVSNRLRKSERSRSLVTKSR